MNPVIGITTYGRHEHGLKTTHYDWLYLLPCDYADSVRRAGGIAVYLPPGKGLFPGVLDRLDGIIFSGGGDIDPARYGGNARHPDLGVIDPERDAAEIEGMKAALTRRDMPILCICRGHQLLNVALGGSLTEHVPDLGLGDMHRNEVGHWTVHDSMVAAGSKAADAMGVETSTGTSGHHQALNTVADALRVTGRAADGLVEAVEHKDHPWCLGVQWHPEITAGDDPAQQGLFDALIAAARDRNAWSRHAAE